jgi:hypothetical protein
MTGHAEAVPITISYWQRSLLRRQGLPIAESYLWLAEPNSIQKNRAALLAKLDN